MNEIKTIVAIYVRVSTQEQANEGYSVGEQQERLKKYAEAHDWTIYKIYTDPGFSGAKMDRPGLKTMIKDARSGKFNKVIVYKLDRLSRSQKDTLYLIEDIFLKSNVDFVSMTENFDTTTPFGKAIVGILSVFAQLEREQIRERMAMGLEARAKAGYFHGGGYDPIGYDYVDGELKINEYEKLQILKVWELAELRLPIHAIYQKMYDAGYLHKHGKWSENAVRSVLTTPIYAGCIEWQGDIYPGRHDPIVSIERFEKMQRYMKSRNIEKYRKTPFRHTSLLGGMVFCGKCGARYFVKHNSVRKGSKNEPYKYYTCYSRGKTNRKMIIDPECKNKNYSVKVLDETILNEIRKLSLDNQYLEQAFSEAENDVSMEIEVKKKRISEIDSRISKLVDLYQIGGIDFADISERVSNLNKEKEALEFEISAQNAPEAPTLSKNELRDILVSFERIYQSGASDELRDIVSLIIQSIIIDGDDITINWKF